MQDDNNKKTNMGPLAAGAGKGAAKAGKAAGKGAAKAGKGAVKGTYHATKAASKGLTKLAAYFSVNIMWFVGIALGIFLIILMLIFGIAVTSDNPGCGSAGSGSDDEAITGGTGAGGDYPWMHKNTKEWKMARETYAACKSLGMDDPHAAAMVGNAANEGAGWQEGWKVEQFGGGGGNGIYQFTGQDSKYGYSPLEQSKSILENGGGPGPNCSSIGTDRNKSGFMHDKGSIDHLTNRFECTFERGSATVFAKRDAFANKAYEMFKGVGGNSSDDASSSDGSSGGGSCGSSDDTDDSGLQGIVAYAKKWLGGLPYSNGDRASGAWAVAKGDFSKKKTAGADCSSFQWGVYRHQGYKTSPQPWAGDIYPPCKVISSSDAKPGDTVILGNKDSGDNGHVMILESTWHGKTNATKVINEGGDGSDVNESGFKDAALSIMNRDALHFVGPVK